MCKECDWMEGKERPFLHQQCDCGNLKWQWTPLEAEGVNLEAPWKSIYRCTKCDSLKLAKHLLHPHFSP